ncbi:GIY-YIG nuclease family protein [Actinosynnema sp. NPDC091369]
MEDAVYADAAKGLLSPERVYARGEAMSKGSVVPARPGVYAWYFDEVPPGVPTAGCRVGEFGTLLYVGIAPKAPPGNGARPSRQHLRRRVGYHFGGNAYGSTLRLTLGCHLAEQLGIELRRVGSGTRLTFTKAGEAALSEWMGAHARVAFVLDDEPWKLEHELIKREVLPLNIADNAHSPYYLSLRALRDEHKRRARALPVTS